jgi:hypothetical protein
MLNPESLLRIYSKKMPKAWKAADRIRQLKGRNGIPTWPGWCFVPSLGWYEIVSMGKSDFEYLQTSVPQKMRAGYEVDRISALGAWRPSKGIYRFEPEILDCLIRTPLSGDMPAEVFFRLPAWCVFIDVQGSGLTYNSSLIKGFFVLFDYNFDNKKSYLMFVFDLADSAELAVLRLPMGQYSVTEALTELLVEYEEVKAHALSQGVELRMESEFPSERVADEVRSLLSLIVYICSDKPDLGVIGRGAKTKGLPKISKGATVTPEAPQVTYYSVGSKTARAIRKAEAGDISSSKLEIDGERASSSRRPHFRQAHWHHFWTGPREPREGEERKLIVRFLLPTLVKGIDKTSDSVYESLSDQT